MASQFVIPVAVLVVAAIIIAAITGVFSSPTPVRIVDTNGIFCPKTISFDYSDNIADFRVQISNKGSNGNMFVAINSNGSLVRGTPKETFNLSAKRAWFMDSGETQSFDFELLKTDKTNFSIDGNFRCDKLFCNTNDFHCRYELSRTTEKSYNLIINGSD